jgi:hypothetical protein
MQTTLLSGHCAILYIKKQGEIIENVCIKGESVVFFLALLLYIRFV